MATANPYLYIVPGLVYIELTFMFTDNNLIKSGYCFASHGYYAVAAVKEVHSLAGAVGSLLNVAHVVSGSFTNQLSADLSLSGAINTVQTGTLVPSPAPIEPGHALGLVVTGGTGYEGAVTLYLEKRRRWNSLMY